jgi:arabinan endo-1,5-alpha-L-arabinosidase
MRGRDARAGLSRRGFMQWLGAVGACGALARGVAGQEARPASQPGGGNNIDFEKELKRMRLNYYRHPPVDVLKDGFRPVGGRPADFTAVRHQGRDHFFYIERRLQEGTPFFPGHEIYFGHASTADFFAWEVHDPVMLVRPGTWEEAHVWAPFILRNGDEFIMAYTGLNRYLSQNIGLASSTDLFEWKRWESNPISPCKGAAWAAWWEDEICSCRDPHMFRHGGRVWMIYTANTKEGASCIAMCSTEDFRKWRDQGPILVGPGLGYEPRLWGGHPQGSLESANLSLRGNRWFLIINASLRGKGHGSWVMQGDRMDSFKLSDARAFWPGAGCIEVVRDEGSRSLLAGLAGGIRFGEVDWAAPEPVARFLTSRDDLERWRTVPPA